MNPNFPLAKQCAELSARAYVEATINGPQSTQVLIQVIDGVQFVAFRGSKEPRDVLTDAEFWRTTLITKEGIYEVHSGFLHAWTAVGVDVMTKVNRALPVVVTGHSLGGALALLCALQLEKSGFVVAGVYTFGQPRVGNGQFARLYDLALKDRTFRFVHEEDIIPRSPTCFLGFRHCGHLVFLNSTDRTQINPPLTDRLISDAWGLWKEWKHRGPAGLDTLLRDHFMAGYQERIARL